MKRLLHLVLLLTLFALPCHATPYFMAPAPTGNDSNNGLSTGAPWASPNHALNCGDTITAAAGAYNVNSFHFGVVTCSAGNNVAWLQCATAFACTGSVTSGGQYSQGIGIGESYWGVQGWVVTTGPGEAGCFTVAPNSSSISISHIIFANDIANGCGKAGFEATTNGSAGVDYFAVVGSIVYGAAAGSTLCESGINSFEPMATDSVAGTHYYYAGNFAYDNVNPIPCNGNSPSTDGEGLFFDTVQPYTQQMVMDNNLSVFNGGNGLKVYNNTTGPANVIFRHNTTYGNETGGVNGGTCSEIGLQASYSSQVYSNLAETTAATACSGAQTYYAYGAVSANSTVSFTNNYGYSAAGNNIATGGGTQSGNTFANPLLSNPTNPSAPSCGSYATTTACMAGVIANFAPTASAAMSYGYQTPSNTSIYDPLFPQWLCNVNLPSGLVTPGCSASSGTTQTITTTVQQTNAGKQIGINLGGLTPYGPQQIYKDLNYANGGSFPGTIWASTFWCNTGTNTTTQWSNTVGGYPTNWWYGATYTAIDRTLGVSLGSGYIIGSNSNGFTLSTPMTRPCTGSTENTGDVIIVRLLSPNATYTPWTPNDLNGGISSSATWNTTDVDPASTNTLQSLEMPNGSSITWTIDQILQNATNPNPSLSSTFVPWININGNYTLSFKAKALTAGAQICVSLARAYGGTTFVPYTCETPTYNTTPGAGWQTYNLTFTGSETGAQTTALIWEVTVSGTILTQDHQLLEGSTLSGNTTVYRDAVVWELKRILANGGSLRHMDASDWGTDVADMIAPTGNRRWAGSSEYSNALQGPAMGYNDHLALCNVVGSDCWISVGGLNNASDWTTLINWLNSSGWVTTFASSGHKIYLEDGNENWNFGAYATIFQGEGIAYGYKAGLDMTAARAAYTGSDSSVIRLVLNSWFAYDNGFGAYGWLANTMSAAGCTNGSQTSCPDFVDNAPYLMDWLGSYATTGSNVSATGAPFPDEWAEITNVNSVTSAPSNWWYSSGSMYLNQQYAQSTYNIQTAEYEANQSPTIGVNSTTQIQMDQMFASVGNGLINAESALLGQRDASVSGPIHLFTLAEPQNQYNDTLNPAMPLWGCNVEMATGPGQTAGSFNVDRPSCIAWSIITNALATTPNLMSSSQSGTPTFSYTADQNFNGYLGVGPTILGNSAVPYVNCFAYANSGKTSWTDICFNNNLAGSETVTMAGAGAPTGTVTQTVFPGAGNVITDQNEGTYVGPSSVAPLVNYPSSTSASATASYTIAPASMLVLTYNTGGTPQAATPTFTAPVPGTYSTTQTPAITSSTSGVTICYTTDGTTPTATTPGTCSHGSSLSNGGTVSISATTTIMALATIASGYTNSTVNSGLYTISASMASNPTFSPVAGTYTSTQSVTLSSTGSLICYNTTGASITIGGSSSCPGGSTQYTGAISVATPTTLYAKGGGVGWTDSGLSNAHYNITAVAPVISPNTGGPYVGSQPVTITDATGGSVICFNFIGSPATNGLGTGCATGSTQYTAGFLVNEPETVYAVAGTSSLADSSVTSSVFTFTLTTWYIRTDGGTRYSANATSGQCNGHYDAAYPGSGVNQNCAFNDYRYTYSDNTNNPMARVIAGGDKILIRGCTALGSQVNPSNPNCRVGWDTGVSGSLPNGWCGSGVPAPSCFNPPIPAGTSGQHTQILGQNYASCSTGGATDPKAYESQLSQIFGGFGLAYALNLQSTQYVDVQCVEFTTHNGTCSTLGSPPLGSGCSTSPTYSDYATQGVSTNNTTANIGFQDVYIHGFNSSGLFGPIGGPITITRWNVSDNAFAGWNFDDGSDTPNGAGASLNVNYSIMQGNGCQEEYPIVHTYPWARCYDSNNAGFGDSWSGQDATLVSFVCNHCQQLFNTKDGFIGPHTAIGTLTITNSVSAYNMGQEWKWGGNAEPNNTTFLNNLTISGCNRMSAAITGTPSGALTYLTAFCRAAGNVIASDISTGSTWLMANNSFITNAPTLLDIACPVGFSTCTSTVNWTNNIILGYQNIPNPYGASVPAIFYNEAPSYITINTSNNIEYGTRNGACPSSGTAPICSDPLLQNEPAQSVTAQSALDNFDFYPLSTSPAKLGGVSYTGLLTFDYYGVATTSPPVVGAVNALSGTPVSPVQGNGFSASGLMIIQ